MNQILKKCYATAVILPSIIGFIAISIYTIITNIAYAGEWLTNEGFLSFVIVFSIVYCVIIYIFALPIFLNLFDYVRQNILLKLCSWFLLPFGFIALVMIH